MQIGQIYMIMWKLWSTLVSNTVWTLCISMIMACYTLHCTALHPLAVHCTTQHNGGLWMALCSYDTCGEIWLLPCIRRNTQGYEHTAQLATA